MAALIVVLAVLALSGGIVLWAFSTAELFEDGDTAENYRLTDTGYRISLERKDNVDSLFSPRGSGGRAGPSGGGQDDGSGSTSRAG